MAYPLQPGEAGAFIAEGRTKPVEIALCHGRDGFWSACPTLVFDENQP